ncbi:HAD-IIA family hydrolase [Paenibacillus hemerocallicola]|uniref:Acid sugar phosphatase n=1 Tax=Paenibacillus hemerocallicola TaxID=1172614 RepID=A0A5C4T362_9BACL|nr:HAD-IIA family hydrolase [Paenibacillus hemerocallicola]TNJ63498.1 HAD-IIA family hydrolase [Paenibacillus hemerocallicola]
MRGFIFDLDGTVYLGDRMIDGAAEAIRTLRQRGDKVLFLSNKPIADRSSYAEKLTKMGIPTEVGDVLNSSLIVARYLRKTMLPGQRAYVIGEEPIRRELLHHGVHCTDRAEEAEVIVLSWDREFTYEKLNVLYQSALRGATVVASNPDATCPLEGGQVPDTGTMIAALETALGKRAVVVAGKPSRIAAEAAVERIGLDCKDCFVIGDRLETDIRMANEAGMHSVLVLTGVGTEQEAEAGPDRPRTILPSIAKIVDL